LVMVKMDILIFHDKDALILKLSSIKLLWITCGIYGLKKLEGIQKNENWQNNLQPQNHAENMLVKLSMTCFYWLYDVWTWFTK
jgi:hypothetical protein